MFLDDPEQIRRNDPQDMLGEIDALPEQLEAAWSLGHELPLPEWDGLKAALVAGMGGSAIGGDLLAAYAAPHASIPILVHRNYEVPAWVVGPSCLVAASSHSGNTEETLSAFRAAGSRETRRIAITTGGSLREAAEESEALAWTFKHAGQPRAAVGYSFGLLLALFARLELIPDPSDEVEQAVEAMRAQRAQLTADVPAVRNPAKRMAGQLMDRWVTIVGAEALAPVARRWKTQIDELAKAWAQFEVLPEADHNTLAGIYQPESLFPQTMVVFLRAPSAHPRNQLRAELTRKAFMLEGLNTDFFDAAGPSRLAHQWTALHFGDYVAYYLAAAYGVDPTPVEAIQSFKQEMDAAGS